MKLSLLNFLSIFWSCSTPNEGNKGNPLNSTYSEALSEKPTKMDYKDNLLKTKELYPFSRWREAYDDGLEQYTQENCNKAKEVFDELIDGLICIGENAPEKEKVNLFKKAVLSLNRLNDKILGLIETGEREDLCNLIDKITIAAGLNPKEYAGGEGIADEWREW